MKSKQLTMSAKNKAFWEMKPEKQRVAVAKDVIKQLNDKFLIASEGTYFILRSEFEDVISVKDVKLDEVLKSAKEKGATCSVCGIGACFASLVNIGDNVLASEAFNTFSLVGNEDIKDHRMRPLLRKVFPSEQLSLIECAFEMSSGFDDDDDIVSDDDELDEKKTKAKKFGKRYKNDKNRLKAIMENIIKNKGTFKP